MFDVVFHSFDLPFAFGLSLFTCLLPFAPSRPVICSLRLLPVNISFVFGVCFSPLWSLLSHSFQIDCSCSFVSGHTLPFPLSVPLVPLCWYDPLYCCIFLILSLFWFLFWYAILLFIFTYLHICTPFPFVSPTLHSLYFFLYGDITSKKKKKKYSNCVCNQHIKIRACGHCVNCSRCIQINTIQ